MRQSSRNRAFTVLGISVALLVAVFLSPFASTQPDGLDRVSQDHGFDTKAAENPPSHQLPFYSIFDEYAVRGVPAAIATPLAGLVGTLATFGIAWSLGKLLVKGDSPTPIDRMPSADE
ncbi:PDGLE domain-containing protein [Leptolyngbya ohadii]|uniref:PDGLE domain-containing protein n=1 Tax=Leptolyngbya ohadii TaxID=1962290 RepID=UPI000B59DB8D|nr:PDGLE domain-containing protein [Leptolyngbya ohadii]